MSDQSRSVRVFLSSTFRDFAEERDLLVRKVFPELRQRARERNVEVIDIDLRWGITPEQAERGEVLPICLAEIDRARPYFFGFIGDRYGWVPEANQYDLSLLVEQPWLDEHRGGKSVTELEMLHGVLNNPAMAGRAFFYFRDTRYSEAKGGAYLSEGEEHRAKLESLKGRIRESGFPVLENYPSPEVLAARVQEDLWRVIDEAFPMLSVPDPVTMERRKHEVYGAVRLGLYFGGEKYFAALNVAIDTEPFKPVLIAGPSGGGKSALVANWVERYAKAHPDAWVITHYLGSSADAADPVRMVYRVEREIAQVTGAEDKLEGDPNKILQHFPEWLSRASAFAEEAGREWIIVLDGLDKLSSRTELRWWPSEFPSRVKLVASCLDGEIQSTLKARIETCEVVVHPLNAQDGGELIRTYLARFNKVLPEPDVEKIVTHPLGGSPLFLRTVAEEMRVFGVHEQLQQRLGGYLASRSMGDLFAKVFDRVEEDNKREDMEAALSVLWGALESFAEDELIAVTGLAPAAWSSILNALEGSLISHSGRIAFGHDYLRKAVENRYLASCEQQSTVMRRLADFCAERMRSEGRRANSSYVRRQAVRHFIITEQWDEAVSALSDLEFVEARAKARELSSMLGDYNEAMSALPEIQEKAEEQRCWQGSMRLWSQNLAQYSAACILQRAEGGSLPAFPTLPKAIKLKTPSEIRVESERIAKNPNRGDTLSAFQCFISTQKTSLESFAAYEGFVGQQAYNEASAGPIHEQGKRALTTSAQPRIVRNWSNSDSYNPLQPCVMMLEGHSGEIHSTAISSDASLAITASSDHTLRVWNLTTGSCEGILVGHLEPVSFVAISADSSVAISSSQDSTLRVWDLLSFECLRVIEAHSDSVNGVAISADASIAVSSGMDNTLKVWDLTSGECCHILDGHSEVVLSVAISAGGLMAISAGADATLRLWDLISGECRLILNGHSEAVLSVAISADASVAVSGGMDNTLRVWDLISGRSVANLEGHSDWVKSVALSADATIAVSAGEDKTLRVWNLENCCCDRVLSGHLFTVNAVAISPDASVVISVGDEFFFRVWNLVRGESSRFTERHLGWVKSVAFAPDATFAISACDDNTLRVWETTTGECARLLAGHSGPVEDVVISSNSAFAVSASRDSTLRVWEIATGECVRVLEEHSDCVKSVVLSPNGLTAVSWSQQTLCVWNLVDGKCYRKFELNWDLDSEVVVSPNAKFAVSFGRRIGFYGLFVRDLSSDGLSGFLEGHLSEVNSVTISGDESFFVSTSRDKTLRVWDIASKKCSLILDGHSKSVTCAVISSDASFVVSASDDCTLRVWNLASGKCSCVLRGHWECVSSLAISATDLLLVSHSLDAGLVRVWDLTTANCVAIYIGNVASLAVRKNLLLSGGFTGDVHFYTLENLPLGPFITTAFRNSTALTFCCGQLVTIPVCVTERIDYWTTRPGEDRYTDPALLMPCPHCQAPLRMNPFFIAPLGS
jgi:WD40 repeat protein